ncbi:hypothetical protein PR048_017555 [Dryococelus australis]|uniref:Uncharacterized protein n=1 Tax=Dryococelus australis TaxID=614101 RepID=A0ABQ9H9U5_9NEOP|nr:hypothetical protein PR048_017555 [Dryococelus australis]
MGERSDIKLHINIDKHKERFSSLTSLFKSKEANEKDLQLAAVEGVYVYHTVQHNESFR